MRISIISVVKSAIPGKKYHQYEVAYKDDAGALKGKKIMSFALKNGKEILEAATQGDALDVTVVQENGYWNWVGVAKASGEAPAASPKAGGYSAPSRDFETSVERAKKQVYIVRQSSISAALSLYAMGKTVPSVEDVLKVARQFEAFVFEDQEAPQEAGEDVPL